ncbi:MAG: AAA family ATPase [Planctomycetes bacterium]|nr:AAA family ATPase [Planctomycetota bacterium]
MKSDELFINGSEWFKADFHLHTNADKEFILPEGYDNNNFIKDYVAKLKDAGIDIGFITNHNKFDPTEFKNLRNAARKEGIFLLAGLELSVNDGSNGIHTLIVFDYERWVDQTNNYIEQFITAAFEGIHNRENENTCCNYNLNDLLEKLDEHSRAGRDSFIIMAHIEQNSGLLDELKGGRLGRLAQSNKLFRQMVLGLQKLRTYDNISRLQEWYGTHPLPAFVEGSDCKCLDDIGKMGTQTDQKGIEQEKACYLKIGNFNFEAIKYALKDKDFRTGSKPKLLTNSYIKSIEFIGGKYNGQKICFSREMNSIIGIRGSGKSAILEVLRDSLAIDYGASVEDREYKGHLLEYTLGSGGKAVVELRGQDHTYRYEKIYRQSPALYQDDILIDTVSIDTLISKPIYFGQKDLSSSGLDFEADLVRRLTGNRLSNIQSQIEQKKREIEVIVRAIKNIRNIEQQREQIEARKTNLVHELKIFKEKKLEEKLKKEARFGEDVVKLNNTRERLASFLTDMKAVIAEHELFFEQPKLKSLENQDLFDKAQAIFEKCRAGFDQLKKISETAQGHNEEFCSVITELNQRKEQLKEEFAKIRREINLPQINPDDFAKHSAELKTIELKLKEIDRSSQKKEELKVNLNQASTNLTDFWHQEFTTLQSEIGTFNKNSESLCIEIEFQGRKDLFKDVLKSNFRGTRLNDKNYTDIIGNYSNFIEMYRNSKFAKDAFTDTQWVAFSERFTEKLVELLIYRVEDKFTIKYHDKPLSEHSLGQRASALILFLLAQKDSGLIIIDQPEDDLDNQTIYEDVIKILRKLKGAMQFIFATHNANIPVLGDSEQVISCCCEDDSFHAEIGSIDNPPIQQKIVEIMEGGEEAFRRRKDIYESWKR